MTIICFTFVRRDSHLTSKVCTHNNVMPPFLNLTLTHLSQLCNPLPQFLQQPLELCKLFHQYLVSSHFVLFFSLRAPEQTNEQANNLMVPLAFGINGMLGSRGRQGRMQRPLHRLQHRHTEHSMMRLRLQLDAAAFLL